MIIFSGSPLYTIDSRHHHSSSKSSEKHFISPEYDERASFDMTKRPALLHINSVTEDDDGQYFCRVDFKWTRTTISTIKLNVIGNSMTL